MHTKHLEFCPRKKNVKEERREKIFAGRRELLGSTQLRAGQELLRSWAPQQFAEEIPIP